jgi:predicted dehydrogenase
MRKPNEPPVPEAASFTRESDLESNSSQAVQPPTGRISRRAFVRNTAALAGLAAVSANRVLGANDRVGVGVIGFGLIGRIHTRSFMSHPDVDILAISDTYGPRRDEGVSVAGSRTKAYADFRDLLADKNVDAVVVATPDHWHALMTMMACAAGKDVYVEKPLTLFVKEGRWITDVAKRYQRVVQVGTQNRSGPQFARARDFIAAGKLGQMVSIQSNYFRNVMPGFGNPPDQDPPPELNWDMWLGPAPRRPYNPNRGIYHFRWFWDYSGGQMTNLGQHSLDLVHWFLDVQAPKAVYSTGGRLFLKDNCEVPDRQDAILEYPGFTAVCQYRECTAGHPGQGMGGLIFHGTYGTLTISRRGFEVSADPKVAPNNIVARVLPPGHPVGGPQFKPELDPPTPQHWTETMKDETGDAMGDYRRHARNFVDCVKSRKQPVSDLESGHRIVTACHLANLSLKTGRKLVWDAEKEEIIGDSECNQLLSRPYREPWDKELKALGVG